jgi:hypothetical protein
MAPVPLSRICRGGRSQACATSWSVKRSDTGSPQGGVIHLSYATSICTSSRRGCGFPCFHHRYARGNPTVTASHSRLRVPVETIVRDLNRFLRGSAGYCRYGRLPPTPPLPASRRRSWRSLALVALAFYYLAKPSSPTIVKGTGAALGIASSCVLKALGHKGLSEMRRTAITSLGVLAVICAMAATANALPSILLLPGETGGSLLIQSVANMLTTTLESELSNKINGAGVLLRLLVPNVAEPKGTGEVLFTQVKFGTEPANTCNSIGDVAGEVLLPRGTFQIVYDSLTVLGVAGLVLVPQVKVTCKTGATTTLLVSVEGSVLVLISPINKELLTSEQGGGVSRCTAGVAKDRFWWNGAGGKETATLSANVGAGVEPACINVTGTVQATISKMAEIMG